MGLVYPLYDEVHRRHLALTEIMIRYPQSFNATGSTIVNSQSVASSNSMDVVAIVYILLRNSCCPSTEE